jgi:hypothetical protein
LLSAARRQSFDDSQHLANLNDQQRRQRHHDGRGAGRYLHAKLLSIAADGVLDMNDNDLIVEYSGGSSLQRRFGAGCSNGFSGTVDPSNARHRVGAFRQKLGGKSDPGAVR